jgi:hypothetical protein
VGGVGVEFCLVFGANGALETPETGVRMSVTAFDTECNSIKPFLVEIWIVRFIFYSSLNIFNHPMREF